MNQLKISTRLALLTAFMAVALMIGGWIGVSNLSASNESLRTVYEDRTVPLGQLLTVQRLSLRNRYLAVLPSVLPERTAESLKTIEASEKEMDKTWADYKSTYLTPRETELAKGFEQHRAAWNEQFLRPALAAMKTDDVKTLRALVQDKDLALYPKLRDDIQALAQLQMDVAKEAYDDSQKRYAMVRSLALFGVVAGVLAVSVAGFLLLRAISRALAQAVAAANAVAAGDLTHEVQVRGRDEISVLMAALAGMRDALEKVVGSVREGSDGVATASAQIAQGNQDLSARTEKQASAIQETSASMEQLGSTVRQNADNAQKANALAVEASGVAARGGEVVGEVVGTVRGISEASRRIADIINVIDGIAFQTNILALNAAVEAARAGEQGRGFAVVASEVRSLAQRSADAAKEIKTLISDSVSRVEQGTAQADRAGATMAEVVASVERVTHLMAEISGASREQSQGVAQVGEAVTQMDQATQQNAALVEEMAAAANSLSGQAQDLVKAVGVFRLRGQGHAARATPVPPAAAAQPAMAVKRPDLSRLRPPAAAAAPVAPRARSAAPVAPKSPAPALALAAAGDEGAWESF
ncbi:MULTISPECIES: methyl-accepting chemotaxis protein [Ramlibacter]|uniref:MCP four helix bundle domain-containing protein n=1 Tax=Ramlibacter aquaticus TaxID=2780094 RepID=A0ABR9SEP1_9BURK|nr:MULTISPECIES: methyl-accepting chemotaxis protein [Ramlibacter]MBE7940354.1 MCP four helix bundle domain-containing protein [Ramlibacter aquaticus]